MAAYVIVDIEITDPVGYEAYRQQVAPTLEVYGGRFLVRGGAVENLEGDWHPKRMVVLEFSSVNQAKAWWNSTEYRGPKELRQRASTTRMVVVEGAT